MKQVRIGDITIVALMERGLVRTDEDQFDYRFKRD
jgi:hypothetical protein